MKSFFKWARKELKMINTSIIVYVLTGLVEGSVFPSWDSTYEFYCRWNMRREWTLEFNQPKQRTFDLLWVTAIARL
jgi:hypothetical protein